MKVLREEAIEQKPVTMAVKPVPSTPCVTSSAVERDENPNGPFDPENHIFDFDFDFWESGEDENYTP